MKKFNGFLGAWLVFEVMVAFGPPCLVAAYRPFPSPLWLVLTCCCWSSGWAFIFTRMSQRVLLRRWQNDCLAFAMFVKHFRNSDPILANAMWQKVHPNIPPPWLSKEAKNGGQEER